MEHPLPMFLQSYKIQGSSLSVQSHINKSGRVEALGPTKKLNVAVYAWQRDS